MTCYNGSIVFITTFFSVAQIKQEYGYVTDLTTVSIQPVETLSYICYKNYFSLFYCFTHKTNPKW